MRLPPQHRPSPTPRRLRRSLRQRKSGALHVATSLPSDAVVIHEVDLLARFEQMEAMPMLPPEIGTAVIFNPRSAPAAEVATAQEPPELPAPEAAAPEAALGTAALEAAAPDVATPEAEAPEAIAPEPLVAEAPPVAEAPQEIETVAEAAPAVAAETQPEPRPNPEAQAPEAQAPETRVRTSTL